VEEGERKEPLFTFLANKKGKKKGGRGDLEIVFVLREKKPYPFMNTKGEKEGKRKRKIASEKK